MEKPWASPRLPSRAPRSPRCGWRIARLLLAVHSLLHLASAAYTATVLFTGSVVMPNWFYAHVTLPAAAAVLGIALVIVTKDHKRSLARILLSALHTFVCSAVIVCCLIGLLRHSSSILLSQQNSPWRLGNTFSDCEPRHGDECHCRHEGHFQRVETAVCVTYKQHEKLLDQLSMLRIAFFVLIAVSVLGVINSSFFFIYPLTRTTRISRRSKHSAPNTYTIRANSLPSLTSGVYERIDSVISSSYLDPLRATVLSELDNFLTRRRAEEVEMRRQEAPPLPQRPAQEEKRGQYTAHSQLDATEYSSESPNALWNTV